MRKRILSFVMAFCMVLCLCPLRVTAATDETAFKAALKDFLGAEPSESQLYTWSNLITFFVTSGADTKVIASVCACMKYESNGSHFAIEAHGRMKAKDASGNEVTYYNFVPGGVYTYPQDKKPACSPAYYKGNKGYGSGGNGHGIIQWSFGRADNLTNFCTSSSMPDGCGYVTVTHNAWVNEAGNRWYGTFDEAKSAINCNWQYTTYKIPDLPGQFAFMYHEMQTSYKTNMQLVVNASDVQSACEVFVTKFMGGATSDGMANRKAASVKAIPMIQACGGVVGSAPVVTDPTTGQQVPQTGTQAGFNGLAASMVNNGYWSEAQLATYCSLTEANLEETLLKVANRSNLGQKDLEGLTDWERNHEGNLKENGYIATLRWVVSLVGILMTLWALFVYLAFWFDHINSFFYLDMLHILTFGQLHICPPGDKPTFDLKKKVKTKTVSHFQIICICLTALLFGALLISGVFYQAVNRLVHLILSFFR